MRRRRRGGQVSSLRSSLHACHVIAAEEEYFYMQIDCGDFVDVELGSI